MNSTARPMQTNLPNGVLAVRADFGSHFLSTHLPFHVINSDLGVVAEGKCGGEVKLPPGQYLVEITLPSGKVGRKVAVVHADEDSEVFFTAENRYRNRVRLANDYRMNVRGDGSVVEDYESERSLALPSLTSTATLTDIVGAHLVDRGFIGDDEEFWVFVPDLPLHGVPTATFKIDGAMITTSLLVNPNGDFPLNSCRVRTVGEGSRATFHVSFGEGRTVSQSIEGLVRAKDYVQSSGLLSQATELLRDKYSDSSGAAFGGLTLLRLGHLKPREDWAYNLAVAAPWLPDAQFLFAAVLLEDADPEARRHGLDLVLSNVGSRPMFSDGLSLALELLRRWDAGNDRDRLIIREALDTLAEHSAHADWSALSLTTWYR